MDQGREGGEDAAFRGRVIFACCGLPQHREAERERERDRRCTSPMHCDGGSREASEAKADVQTRRAVEARQKEHLQLLGY